MNYHDRVDPPGKWKGEWWGSTRDTPHKRRRGGEMEEEAARYLIPPTFWLYGILLMWHMCPIIDFLLRPSLPHCTGHSLCSINHILPVRRKPRVWTVKVEVLPIGKGAILARWWWHSLCTTNGREQEGREQLPQEASYCSTVLSTSPLAGNLNNVCLSDSPQSEGMMGVVVKQGPWAGLT